MGSKLAYIVVRDREDLIVMDKEVLTAGNGKAPGYRLGSEDSVIP